MTFSICLGLVVGGFLVVTIVQGWSPCMTNYQMFDAQGRAVPQNIPVGGSPFITYSPGCPTPGQCTFRTAMNPLTLSNVLCLINPLRGGL